MIKKLLLSLPPLPRLNRIFVHRRLTLPPQNVCPVNSYETIFTPGWGRESKVRERLLPHLAWARTKATRSRATVSRPPLVYGVIIYLCPLSFSLLGGDVFARVHPRDCYPSHTSFTSGQRRFYSVLSFLR